MKPNTNLIKRVANVFRKSHEDVEIEGNIVFVHDEEIVDGNKEERDNRIDFNDDGSVDIMAKNTLYADEDNPIAANARLAFMRSENNKREESRKCDVGIAEHDNEWKAVEIACAGGETLIANPGATLQSRVDEIVAAHGKGDDESYKLLYDFKNLTISLMTKDDIKYKDEKKEEFAGEKWFVESPCDDVNDFIKAKDWEPFYTAEQVDAMRDADCVAPAASSPKKRRH